MVGNARFLVALFVTVVFAVVAGRPVSTGADETGAAGFIPVLEQPFKWKGTKSCSSGGSACHNASTGQMWQQSFRVWRTKDKHARAFDILSTAGDQPENQVSNLMAQKLGIDDPQKADVCLNCHASNPKPEFSDGVTLGEGVSCESCHGPSEKWDKIHQGRGNWNQLTPEQKAKQGFVDTADLHVRAEVCAACHVGSSMDQDVYHDLIAAGHPRLRFELADQMVVMTSDYIHWSYNKDLSRHPDLNARTWTVGQVVSARQSLELLAKRVADPHMAYGGVKPNQPTWPEFAEFNCFSCHHDLANPSWRQTQGYGDQRPGSVPWGTWYLPMAEALARHDQSSEAKASLAALETLRKEMSNPYPKPDEVQRLTADARAKLGAWAAKLNQKKMSAEDVRALVNALASIDPDAVVASWDHAAQYTFALVAMAYALDDFQKPDEQLLKLVGGLADQVGSSVDYSGPNAFTPDRVRAAVQALKTKAGAGNAN